MKIYYAHFVGIYNTYQEKRDLDIINKLFINSGIINPNSEIHELEYRKSGMNYFENLMKDCDLVMFRGCINGKIPAGVYKEIMYAINNNISVLELPSFINRETSVSDTRQMLVELGIR